MLLQVPEHLVVYTVFSTGKVLWCSSPPSRWLFNNQVTILPIVNATRCLHLFDWQVHCSMFQVYVNTALRKKKSSIFNFFVKHPSYIFAGNMHWHPCCSMRCCVFRHNLKAASCKAKDAYLYRELTNNINSMRKRT